MTQDRDTETLRTLLAKIEELRDLVSPLRTDDEEDDFDVAISNLEHALDWAGEETDRVIRDAE